MIGRFMCSKKPANKRDEVAWAIAKGGLIGFGVSSFMWVVAVVGVDYL